MSKNIAILFLGLIFSQYLIGNNSDVTGDEQLAQKYANSALIVKETTEGRFLHVRGQFDTEDSALFIRTEGKYAGRPYIVDANSGKKVWAPVSIVEQMEQEYQNWQNRLAINQVLPLPPALLLKYAASLKGGTHSNETDPAVIEPPRRKPVPKVDVNVPPFQPTPVVTAPPPKTAVDHSGENDLGGNKIGTNSDHLKPTQGHGLTHPSEQESLGKDALFAKIKKVYEEGLKNKSTFSTLNKNNRELASHFVDELGFYVRVLHQSCVSKNSNVPVEVTVTLLTDATSEPSQSYVQVNPGYKNDKQVIENLAVIADRRGLLHDSNDETQALNYTETNTEPELLRAGFLFKQVSLVEDGNGGYFSKYVQKTGEIKEPGTKFKDDQTKDKIYYCANNNLFPASKTPQPEPHKPTPPVSPNPVPVPPKNEPLPPPKPANPSPLLIAEGKVVLEQNCINCHDSGEMAKKLENLQKVRATIGLVPGIAARMPQNDLGGFDKKDELTAEQKRALMAYLESLH